MSEVEGEGGSEWVRVRMWVWVRGAESAVISKNFLQRQFFSPSNSPKTSLGIKIFSLPEVAQTGTFFTSGVGEGEGGD